MSVYLKVTNRCNIRCPHCFIQGYSGEMPLSVVEAVSRRYPDNRIIFHGGEPTLVGTPYIRQAIDILQAKEYLMQSNLLYNIDSDFIVLLKDHFQSSIGTSFDTGRLPYVSTLLDNVRLLCAHGIRVTAVITVTEDIALSELRLFIATFEKKGGGGFTLQAANPVKTSAPDVRYYMTIFKELRNHPMNRTAKKLGDALSGCGQLGINGGNCARSGVRTVDPDGTVYVCPDFAGQRIFPLGNINDPGFDDGPGNVNNRIFYERELNLSLSCCDSWGVCKGGCVSSVHFSGRDCITDKDPFCSVYKEIFSNA